MLNSKISSFQKDIQENKEKMPNKINEIENMLKKFSSTRYNILRPAEN
jgi:SMC interacting uncharacterized protein involved in chromosome segregation